MTEPGGGGVHRVDVVVDCSVDGGRGFEIPSLLPSFLPSCHSGGDCAMSDP